MKTRNSHGLLQLGREALAYCQCASALISGNKALFVSVDLIGEKNQVILEFTLKVHSQQILVLKINHQNWCIDRTAKLIIKKCAKTRLLFNEIQNHWKPSVLCCYMRQDWKKYNALNCTLKLVWKTLHSNLTTLCIVSYVKSQACHCLLPTTFLYSFEVKWGLAYRWSSSQSKLL